MCERCNRTLSENAMLKKSLAFERENAKEGLLEEHIIDIPGCYDYSKYNFLKTLEACPDTVHENLWEHAKMNIQCGLYCVYKSGELKKENGVYQPARGDVFQLRGYDLANMTIVKDIDGWIVMDVLMTTQMANAVWKNIVQKYFDPELKISTVIYSHSHVDHYGGISGLVEFMLTEKNSDRIIANVIGPDGFTEHAVSENIYVGTTMNRRSLYHMGLRLPIGVTGHVDNGLGTRGSAGESTILAPTREVDFSDYESDKKYCDLGKLLYCEPYGKGDVKETHVPLLIQLTPGTEAPAEMNVYMPENKVMFIAENCTGTLHNALTPRGAQVRDLLAWATYLDETIVTFDDIETICSSHNWPRFGKEEVMRYLELQRDMYRYVNNASLHLTNLGYTIDEVGRMLSGEDGTMPLPSAYEDEWTCHGFYGTYNHDAKAVYQRYIGWFDGNPSHLNREKPVDRANLFTKYLGATALADAADQAYQDKKYAFAAELYDIIFYTDRSEEISDSRLKSLLENYADTLRQMGYQSESSLWRNFYLNGAMELELTFAAKNPSVPQKAPKLHFHENTIKAMSLEMMLQFMGIMLSSVRLENDKKEFKFKLAVTQEGQTEYALAYAQRGILGYRMVNDLADAPANYDAALTIKGDKVDFFKAFVEKDTTYVEHLVSDSDSVEEIKAFIDRYLIQFYMNFPIMTPRKAFDEGKDTI